MRIIARTRLGYDVGTSLQLFFSLDGVTGLSFFLICAIKNEKTGHYQSLHNLYFCGGNCQVFTRVEKISRF
jgi:hypothetical protein